MGDAEAIASATGGSSSQLATSGNLTNSVPNISTSSTVGGDGSNATAHASAHSTGGDATATATATGGAAGRTNSLANHGGLAAASANAVALAGDATATARIFAGAGPSTYQGAQQNSPVVAGGAGQNAVLVDAVSGSASGRLTLIQEATASSSQGAGPAGMARSELHGSNPGSGEVVVQTRAMAGGANIFASATPADAESVAVATGANSARVEANAFAAGGTKSTFISCGIYPCFFGFTTGGSATSNATAQGLGEVVASATSLTGNGPSQRALSTAQSLGAVPLVGAAIDRTAGDDRRLSDLIPDIRQTTFAGAAIHSSAPQVDASAILTRTGATHLYGTPSDSDAAAWLADNPNVSAAGEGERVLALGSIALGGSSYVGFGYAGELEIQLANAELEPETHFAIGFLDPTSVGAGISVLHLALLDGTGQTLFERSWTDTTTALAALDDALFPLAASLSAEDLTVLTLQFDAELPMAAAGTGFALDFALLTSPVTEPPLWLLAVAGAIACLVTRSVTRESLV